MRRSGDFLRRRVNELSHTIFAMVEVADARLDDNNGNDDGDISSVSQASHDVLSASHVATYLRHTTSYLLYRCPGLLRPGRFSAPSTTLVDTFPICSLGAFGVSTTPFTKSNFSSSHGYGLPHGHGRASTSSSSVLARLGRGVEGEGQGTERKRWAVGRCCCCSGSRVLTPF
ncbi:hypothetical protein B0H16DRAFT_659746 [Mycena metata]|uniref:Uncharacterized protein n=1 Tax=Mycena metata TaxID=1033252 RepID=A0AAD7GZM9_9AGAR|nr:hypothetical protein B0H16DRAFT_659746 [Mycena metata]